jgi:predicted permease
MAGLLRDGRFAFRRLWTSPGFTLFAIASLALGIGVTTAIYSAVRTLLWMPLGVPQQSELVQVANGRMLYPSMSWADFDTLRSGQNSFSSVAAVVRVDTAVSGLGPSQTVLGDAVSGQFFDTVAARPRLGRLIEPADEASGAHVVVLSHAFWTRAYDSDPAIVGRTLRLGGQPFEVIGVASGTFHGLGPDRLPRSIWIPITASSDPSGALGIASWDAIKSNGSATVSVWARLKPEVPAARAAAEMSVIARQLETERPSTNRIAPRQWLLRPVGAALPESAGGQTIVFMILAAVAALLLIACTNLANLALARGTARAQEIAVRSALGASRWRLVREQLIESALVVLSGGGLGFAILTTLLSYWTGDLPMHAGSTVPFAPQVDASVLTASVSAMLLAVGVFGVWPGLQSTRSDVRDALGAGHGATPPKWRLHRYIIAWQVCGSVALLCVALLSAKILIGADGALPAARHENLALAQVEFRLNGKNEAQMRQLVASILDNARAQRGIRSVSASNGLPFGPVSGFIRDDTFVTTPDRASEPAGSRAWSLMPTIAVTPQFFSTAGMSVVRGRSFSDGDGAGAPLVAIVSEQFARQMFSTTVVVGRTFAARSPTAATSARSRTNVSSFTIVGVCADDEPWGNGQRKALIFVPFAQHYQPFAPVTFLADAADARGAVAALRTSIGRVDPDLSISSAGTGATLLDGLFLLRVIAKMAAALGAIALVLAMAGLFGVLSHVVAKRTREIGIRLAIGADRSAIFRLIVRDGLHPVGKGLLLGLGMGVAARIAVKTFVVTDVAAVDPWPLLLLPVPFILAAVAACYLPAARASRVDPNVALRDL